MRRITLICLALPCVLLGLSYLATAQNVSIQLTPQGAPIQIPATGGSFNYTIAATNNGATPQQATVWCMVTLPNGNPYGPVLGPVTVTIGAGQTLERLRTQSIPQGAPTGTYAFNAYIGVYPNTVWDSDTFAFEKTLDGSEQWVARYNGPGNGDDTANSLAVDSDNNVCVTGSSDNDTSSIFNPDYATIKYDAMGNYLWAARYNGPGNNMDEAMSHVADGSGNVYVTGYSYGSGTFADYATIKYNSAGVEQWVARYNGPVNSGDYAASLALDGSGNVYVTGYSIGSGTISDYATIKYNLAGVEQWVARYNGPGNSYDYAECLGLDAAGNVYVTGRSYGNGTYYDYATIKYDSNGNQVWVARYNGLGNYHDYASSLALDSAANVYITGSSRTGGMAGDDYATIKYDNNGNQVWVALYDGPGNNDSDGASSIALDAAGNVYVTGAVDGNPLYTALFNYATIKYDGSGNQVWVAPYNGPGNGYDGAFSLALDAAGNIYVTGLSLGIGTSYDYATIKYNSAGVQQWVARYNGPGNGWDGAHSLALDAAGNAYVAGKSDGVVGVGENYDYATIKYSGGNIDNWMPVEATVLGQPLPQEFALHQNYPNPFNGKTVARFELRVPSIVSLRVYDTAGRLVATLVDGWRAAGEHELTFDASDLPSGMYVYRVQAGDWTESAKMILLK